MDCRNNILFLNIMFVIVERSSSCSATFVLCFSREIILTLVKIYCYVILSGLHMNKLLVLVANDSKTVK